MSNCCNNSIINWQGTKNTIIDFPLCNIIDFVSAKLFQYSIRYPLRRMGIAHLAVHDHDKNYTNVRVSQTIF